MYTGHFGVGYYFQDDRSVNLELFGAAIRSGIDDDGVALGADLLYRSHFLKDDAAKWSRGGGGTHRVHYHRCPTKSSQQY